MSGEKRNKIEKISQLIVTQHNTRKISELMRTRPSSGLIPTNKQGDKCTSLAAVAAKNTEKIINNSKT